MSEKPKNMKEITIQQLAPIAGRLVALYAAADVEFAATKIAADGTA